MEHSADEMMTVAAARELRDGEVCFVGIGLPSTAANLARGMHAPDVVLIYESGTIGSKPTRLPLSIGDGDLAETADSVVSVPEIFNYWLQGGRIDVGFLGAAQIDRYGNLNSTVIGSYDEPKVRLPGAGGAPEIARPGEAGDHDHPPVAAHLRRRARLQDARSARRTRSSSPTSACCAGNDELVLEALHPGVTLEQAREATGWDLKWPTTCETTEPPTREELARCGSSMPEVFIRDAVRTPVGKLGGALAGTRPDDLAATVVRALAERNGLETRRRGLLRRRQPGRRGQPQRRADGGAAGRPPDLDPGRHGEPAVRLRHGGGVQREPRDRGRGRGRSASPAAWSR